MQECQWVTGDWIVYGGPACPHSFVNVKELIVLLPMLNITVDPVEWSWLSGCFGEWGKSFYQRRDIMLHLPSKFDVFTLGWRQSVS